MNDMFYDMIFKRKSFHLFRNVGNDIISNDEINHILCTYDSLKSLNPDIKTCIKIVPSSETTCRRGEEYCILLYSEKKDGYLQNIGYIGEMLDLYLVSKNIGTLWFGIGKTDEKSYNGLDFVIMIAIKKINDLTKYRKDMFKSKRKDISEMWEGNDISNISNIVRFAPSACNSQPWFVKNDGKLNVYRYKKHGKRGIMPISMVSFYNRIDIGIFMCFLDLCLDHHSISYERELFSDDGECKEFTLNAIYTIK